MYQVFKQFFEDGELKSYYWGEWPDADTANRVALELREYCDSSVVVYKEK